MKSIPGIRVEINIGKYCVEVFKLDGINEYRFGYDILADLAEIDKKLLSNKKSIYHISKLCTLDSANDAVNPTVKVHGIAKPYNSLSDFQIMDGLASLIKLGHITIVDFLTACALETLELRADKYFDIVRTEHERNQRLINRVDGIAVRRTLTDSIKSYIERHSDLSENYKKWIYSNVSDAVNLDVFGKKAKQLCDERKVKKENLRDSHSADDLKSILRREDLAINQIDNHDMEPLQAIRLAIATWN